MDFTTDKLRSLVRKWQTLIEAYVDVRTTDGFMMRLFCIAFTKKRQGQIKRTAYAQGSQVGVGAGMERQTRMHTYAQDKIHAQSDNKHEHMHARQQGSKHHDHSHLFQYSLIAQIHAIRKKMTDIMYCDCNN